MMPMNPVNNKYKTNMCKHYDSEKGCQSGDKCQYAHGIHELRKQEDPLPANAQSYNFIQQVLNSPSLINYKQTKCYYYERDNFCKYGSGCQFAHSEEDIRSAHDIAALNSIATAINCQLNNEYYQSMTGYDQYQYGYDYGYENYQGYEEYPVQQQGYTEEDYGTNYGNYENYQYDPNLNNTNEKK